MGQEKYTTKERKGKHLNYEERIKIEALYRSGLRPSGIGLELERSKRTIERELAKGKVDLLKSDLTTYETYSAELGQNEYDQRATAKGPALKIGNDHKFAEYVETSIKSGFSPYATLQNIKNRGLEFETNICVRTLYTYIDDEIFLGISNKDLPVKKEGKKRGYRKVRCSLKNTKGKSISERPESVDKREETGHWEIDLVVGKQGTKPVVLTLVERVSRKSIYILLKNKTQAEVLKALRRAKRLYGGDFSQVFKSITADNGSEFLDFEGMKKAIKCGEIYYAHPYSSWERGSNENGNRMLRRFIPKVMDLGNLTAKQLQAYEDFVNDYPRRILGGLSANMFVKNIQAA